jgi:hypothetical protein
MFLIILKGYIRNFYFNKISSRSYDFRIITIIIKTYFEIEKNYFYLYNFVGSHARR